MRPLLVDTSQPDPDPEAVAAFYGELFGWELEDVVASLAPIGEEQPDSPPHWSVTLGVDDADAIADKEAELGGTVVVAPFDAPWVRMTVIADPQGATFAASRFVLENRDLAAAEADAPVINA